MSISSLAARYGKAPTLETKFVSCKRLVRHSQVVDAHLLALALSRGGLLATLDRGVLEIVPDSVPADRAVRVIAAA